MIVPQNVSRISPIHHRIGLYLYHTNFHKNLKEHLQVLHKLHSKYFQIALEKLLVLDFPLVEIETSFPIRFALCPDI